KLVLDYFATLVMTKNKMAARLKRLLAMTSRTVSLRQSVLPWQRKCWQPAYTWQRPKHKAVHTFHNFILLGNPF
ncbi:MAG: hypothetical protein J6Q11_05785, partial [Fibrobacteraceae bacterium]|nr:hypothetical protein [Fibrobacteraceae bacterium]